MNKRVESMYQLDFYRLTVLYREDLERDQKRYYPHLEPSEGMLRTENGFYRYLSECFFKESKGFYFIRDDGGAYTAGVRFEPYRDGILLNALMTDADHRRKGYAADLLSEAFAYIDSYLKLPVYSHISLKNRASIQLHRKFGFEKFLDHAVLLDGSVRTDHITYIRKHGS